jgi:hypothetical protein
MPNTLSVAGATRVAWSLGDSDGASKSDSQSSSRSITTGTGPNQANVAWSYAYATTGIGSASWSVAALPVSAFGPTGSASVTAIKEVLITVSTGPTGGYVTFSAPTGIVGARVSVGGQLSVCDYLTGIGVTTGNIVIANGPTGSYAGEITIVGNGSYQ